MSALALRSPEIERTETALVLPDGLPETAWRALGEDLGRANRASAWWIGDWINYGEDRWGDKYADAIALTGLSYHHLARCAAVARQFDFRHRCLNLTWTHHLAAKALDNAEEWLARAEAEKWSVRELQKKTATSAPAKTRTNVMPARRHIALVAAADALVRTGERWNAEMCVALTPPQARKQLTVLNKAAALLAEVIEAVEYRAATPHRFMGR